MKIFKEKKGQVIIFIAILLPVLLGVTGLMVDVGNLYIQRTKLRNAADAIALAATKELPDVNNSTAKAQQYATLNGISTENLTVTTPYNGDSNKISIVISQNVPTYFMRILGFSSTNIIGKAVGTNYNSGFNLIPIAVPDSGLSSCIIWGPSNQCSDVNPSGGGGPLGSQYKGLVNLSTCNESAESSSGDCSPFTAATDYGNKPNNINGWVGNGCNCGIAIGNDIPLYNGNLGSNMGTPLSNRCSAQAFSDGGGAYGLFTVLVYNRIISGSIINISGYAVYKVYCNNISSSSASGTFISYITNDQIDNIVPEGIPTPCLWE